MACPNMVSREKAPQSFCVVSLLVMTVVVVRCSCSNGEKLPLNQPLALPLLLISATILNTHAQGIADLVRCIGSWSTRTACSSHFMPFYLRAHVDASITTVAQNEMGDVMVGALSAHAGFKWLCKEQKWVWLI